MRGKEGEGRDRERVNTGGRDREVEGGREKEFLSINVKQQTPEDML